MLALIYVVTIWCVATILYTSVDELENKPPPRPGAQAPDPCCKRCRNSKTAHVIAASASVAVGLAAMDAAIANYPEQRFTLRNGILVIRQHPRS